MENSNNIRNGIRGFLIIIMVIIAILMIAGATYYYLIKKPNDEKNNQPTITPTIVPTNAPQNVTPDPIKHIDNKLTNNTTFKSDDGKMSLTINNISEKENIFDIKELSGTLNGKKASFTAPNGTTDERFYPESEDETYITIEGNIDGEEVKQCNKYGFLINKNTNTIEGYDDSQKWFGFIETNKGYYFTKKPCTTNNDRELYTRDWKLLGRNIAVQADNDGNIYAFNNKKIVKYDINGNILAESNNINGTVGLGTVYNNVLYYALYENKAIYLVNNDTSEKIKIVNKNSYTFTEGGTLLYGENNQISIFCEGEEYQYNLSTKELSKIS